MVNVKSIFFKYLFLKRKMKSLIFLEQRNKGPGIPGLTLRSLSLDKYFSCLFVCS